MPNHSTTSPVTAVVALGGNALLRRGEPVDAASQVRSAVAAARVIGRAARRWRLAITHGNGPQVGLLTLMNESYADGEPYPLDVLDAETAGQIGYMLELQLDNFVDHQDTVAVITRVVVDEHDPAFTSPTKFIGLLYDEATARRLAGQRGWIVRPDGDGWRRVVPSPEPQRIVQLGAIRDLLAAGFLVVSTGGGGVPVVEEADGRQRGVEAVVDKDLASALLATELSADLVVFATDVDAVYTGFGTQRQRAITKATPAGLRQLEFAAGSMAPKVDAACRFVERRGGRAAIGSLAQLPHLLDGTSGTQVRAEGRDLQLARRPVPVGERS